MCKKGNQCNRTLCFFAHSASELRFPETQDELEAAAVDAAAAQATATPLPLCTGGSSMDSSQPYALGACRSVMPSAGGGSSFGLQSGISLSQVCSDSSASGLLNVAAAPMLQQQQLLQQQNQLHPTYYGSDLAVQVPTVGLQQPDNQSISDPLPRLGSEAGAMAASNPAWLQMAAAAQLTGSQIMSHISRPPGQRLVQQPTALVSGTAPNLEAAYALANGLSTNMQDLQFRPAQQNMLIMGNQAADHSSGANMLTAGFSNLALVDDNSAGSSSMTSLSTEQYMAVLNACNGGLGRAPDMNMLHRTASSAAASDSALLLQQLRQSQQQQQELLKLGSAGSAMSRQSSGSVFPGMSAPLANGSWVRMP